MARRPMVRDVTRMRISTAAFQNPIFKENDPSKGLDGFAPGINPAVLRATDAIVHDVSNAARSISDEYGIINRGEKTMYTADDFSGVSPVYAGTAEKDFYVPREFEENLRTVMGHVSSKWDSNVLTPSVGDVGLNPQYYHEKLVGRTRIYKSQAAMRKAAQEILRRGGMTESAATAKNPYRLTEWLPMSEADYDAAVAAGTLSQATSRLFRGTTPEADRITRNDRARERQRQQEEAAREAQRRADEQRRINERATRAERQRQKREGRMYANNVWNQFKEQERAEALQKKRQERQRRLTEKKEAEEAKRRRHTALTALTGGVALIVALLRRISQAISDIAAAGTQTRLPENGATDMLGLSTPIADSIRDWILRVLDPLGLISPMIQAAFDKVEEVYREKLVSNYTGIDMDVLRRYNTIDMAHGLGSGTFAGGVVSLGQYFSDVRNLSKIDLESIAPLLGDAGLLDDLINLSSTGSTADKARMAEQVLDAYFKSYLAGRNALNQEDADISRRMISLVENLKGFSPELAVILRQMINDYMPGSIYAGTFSDYEGWAFASRAVGAYDAGVGRVPEAYYNVAEQIQQSKNDIEAVLQNVFDEQILLTYQELLTQILSWVQRVAYKFMTPEQQAAINEQNLARLSEHEDLIRSRYQSSWSSLSGFFPGESQESFIKKYFTGHGDTLTTGMTLNQMLATGMLGNDAYMAITDFLVAARDLQALEAEMSSASPVYTASRWTDDYRKMILDLVRRNWITYGVGASNRNVRNNTKVPMGSLGATNYYGYTPGSSEWQSVMLPEGVVSAYESLATTGTLEAAIARGLGMSEAEYNETYGARWLFGNQTDYIDAFVRAGADVFGDRLFGQTSFNTLLGYRSQNDITQQGLAVLKRMLTLMTPEQIMSLKATALARLYNNQSSDIFDPSLNEDYQNAVAQALALYAAQVMAGEATLGGEYAVLPDTPAAGVTSAVDASKRDTTRERYQRNNAINRLAKIMMDSSVLTGYQAAAGTADTAETMYKALAGAVLDKLGVDNMSGDISFSQKQRGGEMRFIVVVEDKGTRSEMDLTDDFNRVMSGYSTSTEMRVGAGK